MKTVIRRIVNTHTILLWKLVSRLSHMKGHRTQFVIPSLDSQDYSSHGGNSQKEEDSSSVYQAFC